MSSKAAKLVLKKNKKLDKIYHPDTGLVFKSATEKVVVGRIVDDEFIPLDDEALELCEKNHFKYDESLVETEETEETEQKPSEEKKSSKKSSHEETVEEPSEEEEQTPKVKSKDLKISKKKSEEPIEETKKKSQEPAKKKVEEPVKESKPSSHMKANSDDSLGGFAVILARHTKELQDFVAGRQSESQLDKDKIVDLETQLSSTKKELEEVKKKLKGVLSAMQDNL